MFGPNVTHGLRSTYIAGCHCDRCKAAQRDYQRRWREATADPRKRRIETIMNEILAEMEGSMA